MNALARLRLFGVCLISMMMVACSGSLPVRSEFDKQADFTRYKTYTWMHDDPVKSLYGQPGISALRLQHIVSAIEDELQRKGYNKVSGGNADFAITFSVGTREKIHVDSFPRLYRGPWYWHPTFWDYEISTRTYEEGMLGIDIFDANSHQPVWHGFTYKRISQNDIENPESSIRAAVAAVLAEFPPR